MNQYVFKCQSCSFQEQLFLSPQELKEGWESGNLKNCWNCHTENSMKIFMSQQQPNYSVLQRPKPGETRSSSDHKPGTVVLREIRQQREDVKDFKKSLQIKSPKL
jgi:hypothetical protein